MPQPQPEPTGLTRKAPSPLAIQGGGHDRFGPVANLAVYTKQAIDLAQTYADEFGLRDGFKDDPEVTVLCVRLAVSRQREMLLLQTVEQELADAAMLDEDNGGYARAMFLSVKRETHASVHEEIRRLHRDAVGFRKELKELARERAEAAADGSQAEEE